MEQSKSNVYIQMDEQGRVIRCEGGYTTPEVLDGWLCIDAGVGGRYNLCQTHYFDGGLYTADGIPRYRWNGERTLERDVEEVEADRASIPTILDPATETQLAVAELAQVVEENNTANQLAIAELAEAFLGGAN